MPRTVFGIDRLLLPNDFCAPITAAPGFNRDQNTIMTMNKTNRVRLRLTLLAAAFAMRLCSDQASATTVTNALTVHLKFDGNLLDSTANKINGTNVALGTADKNGVTFAPGFLGQAVHILVTVDGTTNNYVTLGYPALLHFGSDATSNTTDFSVAMWLKIASSSADEPFISNKNWDSSGDLGWVISNESDGTRVQLTDNVNPKWNMVGHAGPQLEDQTWHHLAVTFQRTNLASTYVDGVLLNTFSIAPAAGNAVGSLETDGQPNPPRSGVAGPDWAINLGEDGTGLYATNNGAALDCLMDDVGIWRRALTASEVQEIYTKATVSGQTLEQEPVVSSVLPANYVMPPGSVNTNQPGFRVRPYQTAATEGGSIAWTEGQQSGLYGPNIADLSGADASGFYTITNVINFNISPGGSVDGFAGADPFPGIGSGNTVNFSEQVITYIEFPAPGEYLLGVNSDDGFGVTASLLNPKDLSTAVSLGKNDGNRGSQDTLFQVAVPVAGIYPIRLIYWQAGGGANLSFFSVVSDSTSTNNVLINDRSTPGALKAYATAKIGPPYATAFNFSPAGFSFLIQDDVSALATNTLKVSLNGSAVNTTLSRSGNATVVSYASQNLFVAGSSNYVSVAFSDNSVPAHNSSEVFTFVVPAYTAVPPSAALPSSAVDTAQRGFSLRISQIDSSASGIMAANIAHAEAQLAGVLIDPTTGAPYVNTATAGPQPDGSYIITNVNFSYDLTTEQGSFTTANGYPDANFPGLNAPDSANMAGEIIGYLDLQPGFYTFGVDATDGFRVTVGANAHDAFGTMVGLFDYRAITAETRFGVAIQTAGIYPFRLVWFRTAKGSNNNGDASLEFYSIDTQGNKTLVNDSTKAGAVKAYWKRTAPVGSYVSYAGPSSFVSPFGSSADVGFTNASLILNDGSSNKVNASSVVWTVDGLAVSTKVTATNGQTMLTYNPSGLQLPRTVHAATVTWNESGTGGVSHTNSWNFHLLRNYILPPAVYFEDFESTPAGPNPSVPSGWTQVNFTGHETAGNDPANLDSDFYLGWVVVDKSFNISKDFGVSSYVPQILNGVAFDEGTNALLVNHYIRAESDARGNGPPGQIQYLYTKPYDLTGKSGIVIAFDSAYEQNQDSMAALEYTLDGTNYYPILYWVQGDADSQAPPDIIRDGLGNIDVVKTMTTSYGDVAKYTDPISNQLVGGYYGFFIKAPITQALAPYIEGRYNDDGNESKRIELYRVPLADNQKNVVFRFVQSGTSSWYWAIDNWGVYSVPSLAPLGPGTLSASLVSGQLNISWNGGATLQSAPNVTGPWTNVSSATSPFKLAPGAGHQFYRLHQ